MKISANWLKEYVDYEINSSNIDDIIHRLAILGFEAENVEHIQNSFENFVVGKVTDCQQHPNADKLTVCMVNVGNEELQIVCGAPNVATGQTVPVALSGAVVGDFKIKKSKLRGEESNGMICAEDELGLSDNHDGIMVLDDSVEAGTPLKDLYGYEDFVFELEVTSNRADVLGYIGFAREFAYMVGKEFTFPNIAFTEIEEKTEDILTIDIQEPEACPRYSGRIIKNVKVGESPQWLKEKLVAIGLRPINNVVDITNFVMMESGHPLHAFDFDNVEDKKIIVRKAKKGEKFTTLDENEYELNENILFICDGKKPVALAGVMGGLNSGVTEETKDVLLEVAYFNLADIRETVKLTKIYSDSSKRFERGIDPNNAEWVINRASALIQELAGGEITSGINDAYPKEIVEKEIELRLSRTEKVLGFKVDTKFIIKSLNAIKLVTTKKDDDTLTVIAPSFRPDLVAEIDLIEEVVRLYGYDKIPEKTNSIVNLEIDEDKTELAIDEVRDDLVKLGLYEISGKSMVDKKYCDLFSIKPVKIAHPLNEEMNHLRNSLLINVLQVASSNIRRKNDNIRIFEVGKVFYYEGEDIIEEEQCTILLTGVKRKQFWDEEERNFDFYDIKGIIEQYIVDIGVKDIKFKAIDIPDSFDPSESLSLFSGKKKIGTFGLIKNEILESFEIKQPTYCFEASLKEIVSMKERVEFGIELLSKYPSVIKDVSVLLNINDTAESVLQVIKKYGGKNLKDINVIDLYKGKQIKDDQKSYSFRMTFQSMDKTLNEKEIDKMFNKVIYGLNKDLEIEIR